jgi:flagellar L-ring protein precursor FlgH
MNGRIGKMFIFCVLMTGIVCSDGFCGSIWAKRSRNAKPIYSDDKANQIGDILTIIISEDHTVDTKVKTTLSKDTDRELSIDGNLNRIDAGSVINKILPNTPSIGIDMSSSKSVDGKAEYKDERTITDKITVVVEDVHPNGNLVVMGSISRDVGGDKQTVQASGIVRSRDITFANTVNSEQVANFQLVMINKGVSQDYNRPGWFAKILDAIWPF